MVSARVNKQKFVDDAADEIDSKLGFLYATVPLIVDPALPGALPRHERLLLKNINNRLASGRLILTLDIAGEDTTLHAYGWSLVRDSLRELMLVANGEVLLTAPRITATKRDERPAVNNHDQESLLLGFEETVMRGRPWYSRPGRVT